MLEEGFNVDSGERPWRHGNNSEIPAHSKAAITNGPLVGLFSAEVFIVEARQAVGIVDGPTGSRPPLSVETLAEPLAAALCRRAGLPPPRLHYASPPLLSQTPSVK